MLLAKLAVNNNHHVFSKRWYESILLKPTWKTIPLTSAMLSPKMVKIYYIDMEAYDETHKNRNITSIKNPHRSCSYKGLGPNPPWFKKFFIYWSQWRILSEKYSDNYRQHLEQLYQHCQTLHWICRCCFRQTFRI